MYIFPILFTIIFAIGITCEIYAVEEDPIKTAFWAGITITIFIL